MIIADETIVAIASPLSPAQRGIVRMSGDRVVSILESIGVRPTDVEEKGMEQQCSALHLPCEAGWRFLPSLQCDLNATVRNRPFERISPVCG